MEELQQQMTTEAPSVLQISVGQFASVVLQDCLESVRKSLGPAAKHWEEDPEYVHQLRVSGRRALAAVTLFSELMPEAQEKWFRTTLKSILRAAARARDLDVLMDDQLPHCGRVAGRMGKVWRKQRSEYQKPIVSLFRKLRKNDCLRNHIHSLVKTLEKTSATANAVNQHPCGPWAESRILDLSRTFLEAIPADADACSLHCLRIATKRMRYTIELLLPVLERSRIPKALPLLEELQKQLGALQDDVVARERFRKSLKYVNKPGDRRIVRRLMEEEDEKIAEQVTQLRFWSDSDACQHIRYCLEPGSD